METKELRRKRAGIANQAREIITLADRDSRARTAEETQRFDSLIAEGETLSREIEQRDRLDALAGVVNAGTDGANLILPHNEARNLGKYSVLRAIRLCADGRQVDGLEGEVSQELVKRRGRQVNGLGFVMPYDLPVDLRNASVGRSIFGSPEQRVFDSTAGVGAGGIQTTLDTTYIDLLRNRMALRQAGARIMVGMHGPFTIPRQNAATTLYWLAEGGSPSSSRPTIDQVPFVPRTAGAYTDITRRLAEQLSTDAEQFVRADMTQVVALGVDLAGLNGTGINNQPLGLLQNTSIPVTAAGTNGGDPTWSLVVALETAVATSNADIGSLAYMTNAKVRGKMKVTPKIGSTFPIYLWENGSTPLNGYPAYVTNQLPSNLVKGSSGAACSPLIFGNWSDVVIAFWSGQDVIVDPFTLSTSGGLRIVMLQDLDINVRHPESFSITNDLTTV